MPNATLNPVETKKHAKAFASIKWMISNASLEVDHPDWKGYKFVGKLPYYAVEAIEALMTDRNSGRPETVLRLNWVTETHEHQITASFGSYRSNQNRIELFYNIYDKEFETEF